MPELPEAETVRRQLEPQLVGAHIESAWARLPRRCVPDPETFARELSGARIVAAKRRGKQIYFPLDSGLNLLVHLGMTGRLGVESAPTYAIEDAPRHVQAIVTLTDGRRLVFSDPRTFGVVGVTRELPFLSAMGPEPLDADFDEAALVQKLSKRATKIKALILDQGVVAGLGNIYADEVCYLARVHPETPANQVPVDKMRVLVAQMRPTLERAIAQRGATLKDGGYADTFGDYGEFRPQMYGRKGEPCEECETPIQRGVLGPGKTARSYHFCPQCQPMPNNQPVPTK